MKRPFAVYLATAVLLLQVGQLAWIAGHIKSDPKYLIGNWQFVGIAVIFTAFFYLKPRIGRWYVVPYFAVVGLSTLSKASQVSVSLTGILAMVVAVLMIASAVLLVRLPASPVHNEKKG
jgi:hypothetical protein